MLTAQIIIVTESAGASQLKAHAVKNRVAEPEQKADRVFSGAPNRSRRSGARKLLEPDQILPEFFFRVEKPKPEPTSLPESESKNRNRLHNLGLHAIKKCKSRARAKGYFAANRSPEQLYARVVVVSSCNRMQVAYYHNARVGQKVPVCPCCHYRMCCHDALE